MTHRVWDKLRRVRHPQLFRRNWGAPIQRARPIVRPKAAWARGYDAPNGTNTITSSVFGRRKGNVAATVNAEKCTGCGACVEVCPVDAIALKDGIAVVDEDNCTECGLCESECPAGAIALR